MSMDLRALRYFVSAVSERSISAAAIACHVAQPSITLAVAKLEEQLGGQLLHRHRKGVTITERGGELYQMAVDLLQHADAIETRLTAVKAPLKLAVSLDRSIRVSYVQHILSATRAQGFAIELELREPGEQADLRITTQQKNATQGDFYPLASERYALLIPSSNEIAYRSQLSLQDLSDQPLIERTYCENHLLFNKVREQFGLNNPVVARVDNEEWALSLVAAGLGVCISPLPQGYSDPRFKVKWIEELSAFEAPERQVGLSIQRSTSSEKQTVLNQVIQSIAGAEASTSNVHAINRKTVL